MISIETPPRVEGDSTAENINVLRSYLYRTMQSLETQLNNLEDRLSVVENQSST